MRRTPKNIVRNVGAVSLSVIVLFLGSCTRSHVDRVQRARASLVSILANMSSHPNGTSEQAYAVRSLTQAIRALDGRNENDFWGPMLVMVTEGALPEEPGARSLRIDWVDPRLEATGIYVSDAAGHVTRFESIIRWDPAYPGDASTDAYRKMGFPLEFDASSAEAWHAVQKRWPAVNLNPALLSTGTKVGLITKDGTLTPAVELFSETTSTASPAPDAANGTSENMK